MSRDLVHGLRKIKFVDDKVCDTYVKRRQIRLPFKWNTVNHPKNVPIKMVIGNVLITKMIISKSFILMMLKEYLWYMPPPARLIGCMKRCSCIFYESRRIEKLQDQEDLEMEKMLQIQKDGSNGEFAKKLLSMNSAIPKKLMQMMNVIRGLVQ